MTTEMWNPARTRVIALGILEYPDGVHWPLEGRRDLVLLERFRTRGVPERNLLTVLDRNCTAGHALSRIGEHLASSTDDELLWFYFAGHGDRDEHGQTCLALYDELLSLSQLFTLIERSFKGKRAVLTADCCYSGGLALEALFRAGRISYAALTSSHSGAESTSAWTFTDCLISALDGELGIDGNGDGLIGLDEIAHYVERVMIRIDGQLASFVTTNGFPSRFVLGRGRTKKQAPIDDFILAEYRDQWYRARILDIDGQRMLIRWIDYPEYPDEWIESTRTRPWILESVPPGTRVEAKWRRRWYPAEVLTVRNGMHLIRYDGHGSHWDEWLPASRLRPPK